MEELIKQIRDGYIEDIRKSLPLSRAVLVLYFWMLVAIFKTSNFHGPLLALMNFSLSDFFELENGLLWRVTPFDLIIIFIAISLTVWGHRVVSINFFDLFSKVYDPRPSFSKMVEEAKKLVSTSEDENIQSAKQIDHIFKSRSKSLSLRIKLSEITFGVCLGIVMFEQFAMQVDIILAVFCCALVVFLQVNVYRYYFSMAAPVIIQRLVLAGELPQFGVGVLGEIVVDTATQVD